MTSGRSASPASAATGVEAGRAADDEALETLREVSRRVLWLATAIVDAANRQRPNSSGVKAGGHQASSASMVDIMVALWFHCLLGEDQVSVKPHAAPALHAINYLLGDLDPRYLSTLRQKGGLQSYPSRTKDPDRVDFSTGSVGIGATAPLWAALAHRYLRSRGEETPGAGRFVSLLGDAELDEGAIWEAIADPAVARLGELLWVVDFNRQSLDRVVPDVQIQRLSGMFSAAGWEVVVLKWGSGLMRLFERPGGGELRALLEAMSNEEYQRLLRLPGDEVRGRLGHLAPPALEDLLGGLSDTELRDLLRDLGGHDLALLTATFDGVSRERPTVVFAYTVKGRGLPTEGHPNNHSALLRESQLRELAASVGADEEDPWRGFAPGSRADLLCVTRRQALTRPPTPPVDRMALPASLDRRHQARISTQAALGRFLVDLTRTAPEVAARVVTCSPDVASSTNLGGWINRTGVWAPEQRRDWFADDAERLLRWAEDTSGQHIELGIAEVNLVGLLGELGATWSRWGSRLIPLGTIYDPFVSRALEPWSYGIYAGGQSILVGTPSGVTLAPEGGAHQSITTPSIGLEQPGCVAWEPAFAQDLEWCLLHAMSRVGVPDGTSAYFRLSTRPVDQALAAVPEPGPLRERRRRHALAGGYRLTSRSAWDDDVLLVGVGAVMTEVLQAAQVLASIGVRAGVVCLTSPDLLYRSVSGRGAAGSDDGIAGALFPREVSVPVVSVQDGHPHTLSFLASIRGDRTINLGVREFGQSSDLEAAYELHGIDAASVVDAALSLRGR